ncbi:hypothetical protein AAT19DRAFT_11843 [Rhodotorula toruloides]|uniref:Uncharacterized protein n=1 Tax=Rhodotorula toruloides TaxID=5286 RepID=A0A2S9ZVP5_RHOTO|nr:hypothetical protein AAT19DRAFT_11843 [Rhodotorula toruloides]
MRSRRRRVVETSLAVLAASLTIFLFVFRAGDSCARCRATRSGRKRRRRLWTARKAGTSRPSRAVSAGEPANTIRRCTSGTKV